MWIAIGVAVVIVLIALFAGRGRDTSTTIVDRTERLDPMDSRNDAYIHRRDDDQIRRAG